ncbi:MAG TPA: ribosome small subunit-dependent GTPase A [Gemmatimonadaceae bacterium]|nr:ribosome small subunit-dependent GTPase A [Gemmatimonadaceae bacterium]
MKAVVLRGTGGVWHVRDEEGRTRDVTLRGRLKQAGTLKLAVGDEVVIEPGEPEQSGRRGTAASAWTITAIGARRSALARRAPGGAYGERVVVANVDQVVVVFAAAQPEPHLRMLDRFLVIAAANDIPARIVINKMDLATAGTLERFADYTRAGYEILPMSARMGIGLDALHELLHGRNSVLTGPSGVGKSSLLNTVYPGLNLRVGAISASVNKGRHTTVGAFMFPLPDGGFVVDTPGLREVGVWNLAADALGECFVEFRPFTGQCRFRDCSHRAEPGCAVREAVAARTISDARYESYLRLLDDLAANAPSW